MTTEHSPDPKKLYAKQEFRLPRMIEGVLASMDLGRAMRELIDNALDETPKVERAEVVITFDPNPKNPNIVFEHRNTTGMTPREMQKFPIWGEEYNDPSKYRQYGWGGKLADLFLISRANGSVTVSSRPKGSTQIFRMHIPNWWQKLSVEPELFQIETEEIGRVEERGYTRFELTGAKKELIPINLGDLAEELGLTYGPLIESGRLNILLRRFKPATGVPVNVNVLAIKVPFDHENSDSKFKSFGTKKGPIKMEIEWGLIDTEERRKQIEERAKIYGLSDIHRADTSQRGGVYLYYHGKLLSIHPLSHLRIARTTTASLQSFAVLVNIVEGLLPLKLLKTGLSLSAVETAEVHRRVRAEVEQHILLIARETDRGTISRKDLAKVNETRRIFQGILLEIFNRNMNEIARTFGISVSTAVYQAKSLSGKEKRGLKVPGMRAPSLSEAKNKKVSMAKNPIPEFSIKTYPENFPPAEFVEGETGPLIIFNVKSPVVRAALRARGGLSIIGLMQVAAWALYQEKWIRLEEADSRAYEVGMQRDVSLFLEAAAKLNLL